MPANPSSIEDRIEKAVEAIRTREKPVRAKIAREFDVPLQRLRSRLTGRSSKSKATSLRNRALTEDQDIALHHHISRLGDLATPLRLKSIRLTANAILRQAHSHPFDPPPTVSRYWAKRWLDRQVREEYVRYGRSAMATNDAGPTATDPNSKDGMTLTVLGCGTLGIAILSGIFLSLTEETPSQLPSASDSPPQIPTRFIACVTRAPSAQRIETTLLPLLPATASLQILQAENLRGVKAADVVILACKPQLLRTVLAEPGLVAALQGKLLVSILAGVSTSRILDTLSDIDSTKPQESFNVVRVMPNCAALIRESMTVIATPSPPLPAPLSALVDWIFTRIGRVVHLPPTAMDASTALCGSGPAFFALVLEAIADGAVAMGLPRAEAQLMAAQTMRGCANLVLGGEHPAMVREKVSTPGGCTIGGLMVLEEGKVRGTVARGVREATVVAGELGKGMQGVNGTRF